MARSIDHLSLSSQLDHVVMAGQNKGGKSGSAGMACLLVFMRVGGVGVYIIRSPAAKYVPSFESRDFFFIQAAAALSLCVIVLCNGA